MVSTSSKGSEEMFGHLSTSSKGREDMFGLSSTSIKGREEILWLSSASSELNSSATHLAGLLSNLAVDVKLPPHDPL